MKKEVGQKKKTVQIVVALRTAFRLLGIVWRTNKLLFSLAVIVAVIPGVTPFVNAYIYKLVIDFIVSSVSSNNVNFTALYPLVAMRVATYFLQDAAFRVQYFTTNLLNNKMPIVINQLILQKISSLDVQYFEDSTFKDLLEKVRETYSWRPQNLVMNFFYSLQSIVQVSIALLAILQLNWVLFLLIFLTAIPEFIIQAKQSKVAWSIWQWNSPRQKRFWYLANLLQEAGRIKEIKIFKLAKKFLQDIKGIQETFYTENARLVKRMFFFNIGDATFSTIVIVAIEVFVIFQALARKITIGDISFYSGVVTNFQTGLHGLFRNVNLVFENTLYVGSIFEVLDAKPVITSPENAVSIAIDKPPLIEFKDVDFAYPGTEKKVLKHFSLVIQPEEKAAFVGENGAGKSTIIKLLARLYDVDKGEILVNGVNIRDIDLESWHQHLGILFQDFTKYEYSVKDNIHYGDLSKEADLQQIEKAATEAGADEVIATLEKHYEQMLGRTFEDGVELSVGQWQKIALARAFFRNAPVLILDEPTSAIDAKAEAEIFEKVNTLSKGKTVVIISHRFSTVRQADKIYVIDQGKIAESGNHEELMKVDGQYAKLFRLQAKGYR